MDLLFKPKCIFWDFDGVIKDSVEVKTHAFEQLFQSFGVDVVKRVRDHHEAHGGMSRFEKIPHYLELAGELATPERVEEYCQRFAMLTLQGVIDAPWVPGVEAFLRNNPFYQSFVLVTATPQKDIEEILTALNLQACFIDVFGAPVSKEEAIHRTLAALQLFSYQCLMIGDAKADWDAARANEVPFLLRRHATNGTVFKDFIGDSVVNFTGLKFIGKE